MYPSHFWCSRVSTNSERDAIQEPLQQVYTQWFGNTPWFFCSSLVWLTCTLERKEKKKKKHFLFLHMLAFMLNFTFWKVSKIKYVNKYLKRRGLNYLLMEEQENIYDLVGISFSPDTTKATWSLQWLNYQLHPLCFHFFSPFFLCLADHQWLYFTLILGVPASQRVLLRFSCSRVFQSDPFLLEASPKIHRNLLYPSGSEQLKYPWGVLLS